MPMSWSSTKAVEDMSPTGKLSYDSPNKHYLGIVQQIICKPMFLTTIIIDVSIVIITVVVIIHAITLL